MYFNWHHVSVYCCHVWNAVTPSNHSRWFAIQSNNITMHKIATFHSGADQRKYQRSASLAFVRGIHRWPVNSPHKRPVTQKMSLFDDVRYLVYLVLINQNVPCGYNLFLIWNVFHHINLDSLFSWIGHSNPLGLRIIEQVNEITFKKIDHMFCLSQLICFPFCNPYKLRNPSIKDLKSRFAIALGVWLPCELIVLFTMIESSFSKSHEI